MAPHPEVTPDERSLSPMALRDLQLAKTIVKRADDKYQQLASAGAKPPQDFAGPGYQALFAIIGVGMVLTAIWFFFWAKNGGFKWRKDDWEDYKSTVMRRKGPDGKTLSNASKSTRLGGGSVVHGGSYGAESSVGYTDETGTSADFSETYRDAEEGKGLRGGDGKREKKKHRRDHTNDLKDPELRQYREEKVARVGGLNRNADGIYTDYSGSVPGSDLGSNVSSKPLVKKDKKELTKAEMKAKEQRAKERFKKAKAAEKEAARKSAAEAKAIKEAEKAEAKRAKDEQKKMKKARSQVAPSEAPEMAEVTQPLTEYTGAYTEYTAPSEYLAPSEYNPEPAPAPKRQSTHKAPSGPRRAPPSAAYSFTTGDDDNATVYTGLYTDEAKSEVAKTSRSALSEIAESSYYSDYRPRADASVYKTGDRSRSARPSTERASRPSQSTSQAVTRTRPSGSRPNSQSPTKQHRTTSQSPTKQHRTSQRPAPPQSDIFTANNGEARGHMSYPCHIPGLSQSGASSVGPYDSVSQAGGPPRRERGAHSVMDGYRRGGVRAVGRRDSLSDSD
ncbi:hypothetical protein ACN47E_004456 [Coniothyrium glycines]